MNTALNRAIKLSSPARTFMAGGVQLRIVRRVQMELGIKLAGRILLFASFAPLLTSTTYAQNIGWEGETGVFVTPLAYTVGSPAKSFSAPIVGFHYLGAGSVIGDFYETSVTMGALGRTEFGYTRNYHSQGGDPGLSPLWSNGFNIAFGKVNIIPENLGDHNWIPA